jgi:hypothetical protein
MGYMGFGLQKWIYTQKPRKIFNKLKDNYGDNLENTPTANPDLRPKKYDTVAKSLVLERARKENEADSARRLKVLIVSMLITIVLLYLVVWIIKTVYFK